MTAKTIAKTATCACLGLLILGLAACGPSAGVLGRERDALVAFYEGTNGPEWWDQRGWLSEAPVCEWYGVGCEGGQVVSLTMNWNNLSGALPAALAQLTELHTLVLYYNNLSGALPAELAELQNLDTLILHHNRFEGELPEAYGTLARLRIVDLEGNRLSGGLPASWGQMSSLEVLNLRYNRLSGELPAEIGELVQLEGLLLSSNDFEGSVPEEWLALTNLKMFGVYANPRIVEIPPALEDLPRSRLEFLNERFGY